MPGSDYRNVIPWVTLIPPKHGVVMMNHVCAEVDFCWRALEHVMKDSSAVLKQGIIIAEMSKEQLCSLIGEKQQPAVAVPGAASVSEEVWVSLCVYDCSA